MHNNPNFEDRNTVIYGYGIELTFEHVAPGEAVSDDNVVSSCFVSRRINGEDYCSSLTCVEAFGTIENENGTDDHHVSDTARNAIEKWAADNGY